MKARITLIVFVILIILACITLILLMQARFNNNSPIQPIPFPTKIPINVPVPTGEIIEVSGVPVKNPYISPTQLNQNGDSLMVEQPGYSLVYLKPFGEFLITITASPFEENRKKAEEAFLLRLGITQGQACRLKVTITTPVSVNPTEAGQKYPLSFCQ